MFDEVLQLAHVSGPVVTGHQRQRFIGDVFDPFIHLLLVFRDEVPGKNRNILSPMSQGGQAERKDAKTIKQIRSEGLLFQYRERAFCESGSRAKRSSQCSACYSELRCYPSFLTRKRLFGHERGAFTGAVTQRTGRFEMANGGTLFLDEIGDMALELQPKLLRVLQEHTFERPGSARTSRVNVRVIAATNRDLLQMQKN